MKVWQLLWLLLRRFLRGRGGDVVEGIVWANKEAEKALYPFTLTVSDLSYASKPHDGYVLLTLTGTLDGSNPPVSLRQVTGSTDVPP